jgi:hypothetical protein
MSDEDRIEIEEIVVIDRATDTYYRKWTTPDGTVVREECFSPSPVRALDFDPADYA